MHAVREHLAAASTDAFRLVLAQCKRKQSIDNSGKRHTHHYYDRPIRHSASAPFSCPGVLV